MTKICVWRIILVFLILLEVPLPVSSVTRPAGWNDDGIYRGEEAFKSGLRCYDCIDCFEPFSYEHRECYSAINCYVVRCKLAMNGYSGSDARYWKERLPEEEFLRWRSIYYKRNITIRGCSDYGFNCAEMMTVHESEGIFKAPFHGMRAMECDECATDLCNDKKTQDPSLVDRAVVLATDHATMTYSKDTVVVLGIVFVGMRIINALGPCWCCFVFAVS